jgi:putative ABC transport system permease protein
MILRCLLRHYRRHPVQAGFLLVSIVLANVLLVGTQLINAQARASYAAGEQLLRTGPVAELRARESGRPLDERDYVRLRLQGFDMLIPALREPVRTGAGESLELLGIDALAIPRRATRGGTDTLRGTGGFAGFSFPPYQLWASGARLRQLGRSEGERIPITNGGLLPPLRAVPGENLGHRLLLDLGALQSLTGSAGQLSSILVFPAAPGRLSELRAALPPALEYVASETAPDPAELTRSLHLNLAAMGLLAFVVGVFLTYNALAFSYTDRHELLRKLRLAGVTRGELARALLLELGLFLGLGSLLGAWLGAELAALLLPGVGQTLAQLYGVYIAYPDALTPGALWLPLAMTAIAALLCMLYPMRQSLQAPLLERQTGGWLRRAVARRDLRLLLTGLALLALAGILAAQAQGIRAALAGMASLLLGAALCLPAVLRALLAGLSRLVPARHARARWLLADSRWLLGPAALALMAMTLALVANSGLSTMISSFRQATDDWLQQRLAAQLYFRTVDDTGALVAWLEREAPGVTLTRRYRSHLDRPSPAGRTARIEVVTLPDDARYLDTVSLLRAAPDALARFARGAGVFISERAWRLDGWQPGDTVELCMAQTGLPVLGIYRDYGNPLSQWMISPTLFAACWPQQGPLSLALLGGDEIDWAALRNRLLQAFKLQPHELIDQAELKSIGIAVFDRTFRVTNALNALTLLVASIGVFCAVSAIHHHRIAQQALLASLGVSRRARGAMLLAQWGLLGLLCMALVWPFGTVLAGYLTGVVTPVAFGWSFPLLVEWQHYGLLAALAAACMLLAVALPSLRLLRTSPAAMLRAETV